MMIGCEPARGHIAYHSSLDPASGPGCKFAFKNHYILFAGVYSDSGQSNRGSIAEVSVPILCGGSAGLQVLFGLLGSRRCVGDLESFRVELFSAIVGDCCELGIGLCSNCKGSQVSVGLEQGLDSRPCECRCAVPVTDPARLLGWGSNPGIPVRLWDELHKRL